MTTATITPEQTALYWQLLVDYKAKMFQASQEFEASLKTKDHTVATMVQGTLMAKDESELMVYLLQAMKDGHISEDQVKTFTASS